MGLLDSPVYLNYKKIIAREIHKSYQAFLADFGIVEAESIVKLNQQSRMNGGENPVIILLMIWRALYRKFLIYLYLNYIKLKKMQP